MGIGELHIYTSIPFRDHRHHRYRCFLPRAKEVGCYQLPTLVVFVHEAVRYVDQNGEENNEEYQVARISRLQNLGDFHRGCEN